MSGSFGYDPAVPFDREEKERAGREMERSARQFKVLNDAIQRAEKAEARIATLEAEVERLRDAERIAWCFAGAACFNPRRMPFLIWSCKVSWPPYTEFPANRLMLYAKDRVLVLGEATDIGQMLTPEARAIIDAARAAKETE